MLDIINLDFDYHDKPLFRNVQLQLSAGNVLHLCGKNGTGKTTLLRMIAGIFEPDNGEIRFEGKNIQQDKTLWQEQLCFIGHKSGMHPQLTVAENFYHDLQSRHIDINAFLKQMALESMSDRVYGTLSAGQQKRIALMRLCLSEARVWLLDEPLVALDESMVRWLMQLIEKHRKNGGYVILTSHQTLPASDYQEYSL